MVTTGRVESQVFTIDGPHEANTQAAATSPLLLGSYRNQRVQPLITLFLCAPLSSVLRITDAAVATALCSTAAGGCWDPAGEPSGPQDEEQHHSTSGWLYDWFGAAGASHANADTSTPLTSPPMTSARQQHPPLQLQQQLRMAMAADTAPAAAVAVDLLPSTTDVLVSSRTLSQSARDAAEGEQQQRQQPMLVDLGYCAGT